MDELEKSLRKFAEVETDVPLSTMTTLRIGGKAGYVVYPDNTVSFDGVMRIIRKYNVPYKILGNGSNLLCSDKPFDGVVVSLRRFDDYYFDDCRMIAQAGCSIIALSYQCLQESLSGLEFASGIPGSIGGAAYMNAGAYGGEMSKIIVSATTIDGRGDFISYGAEDLGYSYRHSRFMESGEVIVDITLSLKYGNQKEIKALMDDLNHRRRTKQPLEKKSAGSTFKRPEGHFVGQMIEELGLKGYGYGDAQVSEKHAGFLINNGHASCEDMLALIHDVQDKVKKNYGVDLYTEVQIVGEE